MDKSIHEQRKSSSATKPTDQRVSRQEKTKAPPRRSRKQAAHHRQKGKWQDVSADSPCPICGKPNWCTTNADRTVVHCRRNPDVARSEQWVCTANKADRHGGPYGRWERAGDASDLGIKSPAKRTRKIASAEVRDQIYRTVLAALPLTTAAASQLRKRGLNYKQQGDRQYGYLDGERDAAVRAVYSAGLASHLGKVPGFYRADDGYFSLAGREGILVPVRDHDGRIIALKIRVRNPVEGRKYSYVSSKKRGGTSPGSPVHVPLHTTGPVESVRITEGELKADIATVKTGVLTLGLPGVAAFAEAAPILKRLHPKQLLIAFDADYRTNPVVATALAGAITTFRGTYEIVVESWPREWGKGIDDVLADGKKPADLSDANIEKLLQQFPAAAVPTNRPTVEITTEEQSVNDQAVAALANDRTVFQRGNVLVHVLPDQLKPKGIIRPEGTPRIAALPQAVLRERLAQSAQWVSVNAEGEFQAMHPPKWSIEAIYMRGQWAGIRPLEGIVTGPVLRADGTILAAPGYDAATGLICEPSCTLPSIPSNPTSKDIHNALALLREAIVDFPLEKETYRAAWIAFLLTMLAQYAFPGPAPLYLAEANTPGTGKGLICDLSSTIATGRLMSRMANPKDDDEARKRITAIAIAADPHVLIDNIEGPLGSPALDAALTCEVWKDRILGRSAIVEVPLKTIWSASGNNVQLVGDLPRRVMRSRLETLLEHPEERTEFAHPNLLAWARERRGDLLAAALTLLRGYVAAGRPSQGLPAWGSFEGWSDLVRSTVVWAGLPDPADTRKELTYGADPKTQALAALMNGLQAFDPEGAGLTVSEILALVADPKKAPMEAAGWVHEALAQLCPTPNGAFAGPQKIGMTLHHLRLRVVEGRCLDKKERHHTAAWYVRKVETGTTGATGTSSNPSHGEKTSAESETYAHVKGAKNSPRSSRSPRRPVDRDGDNSEVL